MVTKKIEKAKQIKYIRMGYDWNVYDRTNRPLNTGSRLLVFNKSGGDLSSPVTLGFQFYLLRIFIVFLTLFIYLYPGREFDEYINIVMEFL